MFRKLQSTSLSRGPRAQEWNLLLTSLPNIEGGAIGSPRSSSLESSARFQQSSENRASTPSRSWPALSPSSSPSGSKEEGRWKSEQSRALPPFPLFLYQLARPPRCLSPRGPPPDVQASQVPPPPPAVGMCTVSPRAGLGLPPSPSLSIPSAPATMTSFLPGSGTADRQQDGRPVLSARRPRMLGALPKGWAQAAPARPRPLSRRFRSSLIRAPLSPPPRCSLSSATSALAPPPPRRLRLPALSSGEERNSGVPHRPPCRHRSSAPAPRSHP